MAAQIKIRPGAPLKAALRATAGEEFPTGRINAIADRYLQIVEAARPLQFSRAEWLAIFDANNGAGSFDELVADRGALEWAALAANVADTIDLGDKWGIDQAALVRKIDALPLAAKIAVLEVVQRFWALHDLPADQALDLATRHPQTWPPLPRKDESD